MLLKVLLPFTSHLLLCAPAFYPSQCSCTKPSNSSVYLPSCCPVGCSVDSCSCSTKAHRLSQPRSSLPPVYNGVRASCSSPLLRLLSLDRSTSVLGDASQPRGASKRRGDRRKEEEQQESPRPRERERTQEISNIICCPCVSFLLRAEDQQPAGGCGGLQPVLITSVLFMLLTHMWYWCVFTGAWQAAVSEERASSTAQLPPPSLLCIHGHLFFSMDVNIFWPSHFYSTSVYPNHSPLALFPFFSVCISLPPNIHISSLSLLWPSCSETGQPRAARWHWRAKLPRMHARLMRGAQQRPHGIYVRHRQSHSDPRDSLIINSNLNLTSNVNPRDNIVVMISAQEPTTSAGALLFSFLPSVLLGSPSHDSCITDTLPGNFLVLLHKVGDFSADFNEAQHAVKAIVNHLTKHRVSYISIAAETVRIYWALPLPSRYYLLLTAASANGVLISPYVPHMFVPQALYAIFTV